MKNLARIFLPLALFVTPFFVFAQTEIPFNVDDVLTREQQQELDSMKQQVEGLLNSQGIAQNAVASYLNVRFSPKRPKPGETVRVSAESYLVDLSKVTMSWSVNGRVVKRGIGETSFSFQVGASGTTTRLGILITMPQGGEVYKEYGFSPIGLTILWEADTYTPPFYKGKPLISYQSRVRAVAVPDAVNTKNAVRTDTLSYTWSQNGSAIPAASGYGKNSYTFIAPRPYEDATISVSASPTTGSAQSEFFLNLPIVKPFILFYEESPLFGVRYGQPLSKDYTLSEKDVLVRAEPFFFSNEQSETPSFSYSWNLNGREAQKYGRSILLSNTEGVTGESTLTFGMHGIVKTFQSASQSLRIKFEEKEAPSRF